MGLANKIIQSLSEANAIVADWRSKGEKIVFTNGCFDIIHIGHVLYLEQARSLGQKLIVGINSDASVRRLKGELRPINDLHGRMHVLAALASTDMVIVFEGDTPYDLIASLLPDILVKGGDWRPDQIVGSDLVIANGGSVQSLQFVDGYSTTAIERKIKGA
jgi:D-glycero-beta-D-manno-heptose 1-phosphate adenylyltransferase